MTIERRTLASRIRLTGVLLVAAAALPACNGEDGDFEGPGDFEDVEEVAGAIGVTTGNNLPPAAVDSDPLARPVTNTHGITSASDANPRELCQSSTVTSTGCVLRSEWKAWADADTVHRLPMMRAIVKCAVEQTFTIQYPGGAETFPGKLGLYSGWKTSRLTGQDKRERMSSCILSLLNGDDQELAICLIGPGGAPFSTACQDPAITTREGGFFGDLFAETPTAYVAGPDSADPALTGRACFAETGSYCCAEEDTSCEHRIVLAGAILGSPEQGFANKRCNQPLAGSGGFLYCPSFHSTREPGRSYTNVFTSFVPPLP